MGKFSYIKKEIIKIRASRRQTVSMSQRIEQFIDSIQLLGRIVAAELPAMTPCSEYELIKRLREHPELSFFLSAPADSQALFRNHFLLFHVLYKLRDQYWQQQTAQLQISPLMIQYLPYQTGQQALTEPDPLRDYYLDLTQLQATSQDDVDEMLGRFWVKLHQHQQRDDALAVLGLSEPVDALTIKKTYQKLVMAHHPDRGGDVIKLQELNLAMEVLKAK